MKAEIAMDLGPVENQSLATRVLAELETMILSEELEPGSRINEKAIAERLSISRSPVREALRRLEQAGLVEIRTNKGVFVRTLDRKRATELCDIRCALYRLAGRLAASHVSNAQIHDLRDYLAQMEATLDPLRPEEFSRLNDEFHRKLIEASGSERLRDMLEGIEKEVFLARHLSRQTRERAASELSQSTSEHRAIVEAMASRDPTRLGDAMEFHAHRGKAQVLRFFDKQAQ
ncbi:FCD domain-containing protein [Rhodobacterales bacterium HKCCE2091]|nr:FCD domain-containing protein [Rhodobacterales bacterium HKCCE2091]